VEVVVAYFMTEPRHLIVIYEECDEILCHFGQTFKPGSNRSVNHHTVIFISPNLGLIVNMSQLIIMLKETKQYKYALKTTDSHNYIIIRLCMV
jgi:hypothetical protein